MSKVGSATEYSMRQAIIVVFVVLMSAGCGGAKFKVGDPWDPKEGSFFGVLMAGSRVRKQYHGNSLGTMSGTWILLTVFCGS